MPQHHCTLGNFCYFRVMGNYYQCSSLIMKFMEKLNYYLFILVIQISCRLISEYDLRIINQCSCHAHPLLLTSGKLGRQMFCPVGQANSVQRRHSLILIRNTVIILGKHNIFKRCKIIYKMELLEYESYFISPDKRQIFSAFLRNVCSIQKDLSL